MCVCVCVADACVSKKKLFLLFHVSDQRPNTYERWQQQDDKSVYRLCNRICMYVCAANIQSFSSVSLSTWLVVFGGNRERHMYTYVCTQRKQHTHLTIHFSLMNEFTIEIFVHFSFIFFSQLLSRPLCCAVSAHTVSVCSQQVTHLQSACKWCDCNGRISASAQTSVWKLHCVQCRVPCSCLCCAYIYSFGMR